MPLNRQKLAALLAEKAKQQNTPMMNNPLAKPIGLNMTAPMAMPAPVPAPMAIKPPSLKMASPLAKSPGRFLKLKSKLRGM